MQTATLSNRNSQKTEPPISSTSPPEWNVALVSAVVVLASIAIILFWGLNKGLDPNVEGFYLLSYQHPDLYPFFSSFHLLLSPLPKFAGCSELVNYRVLEVIARFVPAVLLALSFAGWLGKTSKFSRVQTAFMMATAGIGGLMSLCTFPRTVSYNGLSSALVFTSSACMLFALGLSQKAVWRPVSRLMFIGTGALVGLELLTKFTSAIVLLPALFLFMFIQRRQLLDYALVLAGIVISCSGYFLLIQSPTTWCPIFFDTVRAEYLTSHRPSAMFGFQWSWLSSHWPQISVMVACCTLILTSGVSDMSRQSRPKAWIVAIAYLLILGLLGSRAYWVARESNVPILTIVVLGVLLFDRRNINWRSQVLQGSILLALLPIIATFGTNCRFLGHASSNMSPWFLLIAVASIEAGKKLCAPRAMALFSISLLLFCLGEFVHLYVFDRYDCNPLTVRRVSTDSPRLLRGVQLEKIETTFYKNSLQLLKSNGFVERDPLLCLYDMPALVYLCEGTSPGQAWYCSWKDRDGLNAHFLKRANLAAAPRFYLVLNGEDKGIQPRMLKELERQGMPFPQSFRLLGSLPAPFDYGGFFYFYARNNATFHQRPAFVQSQ